MQLFQLKRNIIEIYTIDFAVLSSNITNKYSLYEPNPPPTTVTPNPSLRYHQSIALPTLF